MKILLLAVWMTAAMMAMDAGRASAAGDAWRYYEVPLVGRGGGTIPTVSYAVPSDSGFDFRAECRDSGPSIYITVKGPGPDLRQLRFDTPIPVTFRLQRPRQARAAGSDEARVTAKLSVGYLAHTNEIRVGMGLQDGAAVVALLGRDLGPEADATGAVVELAQTSGNFRMSGAHNAFAQFKRRCDAQVR
jgi:hypothetical protein